MKRLLLSIVLLLPVLLGAQPVYDCHRADGKIKIDGKLNEAAWAAAPLSDAFRDIRGEENGPKPLLLSRMKMLYDDSNLYVAGIIEENDIKASLTDRDAIIWKDNDFEVFIDPYCDGKLYYEFECNALGTVMDLMMEKPYSKDGSFLLNWDCRGIQLAVSHDGTLNKSSDKDRAWYVEMAIPFASLQRDFKNPRDNKVWRMNFSRVEWPAAGGPEENWVWSPTGKLDIHAPELWGYVRFIENGVVPEIVKGTVVKNWIWERLKPEWSDEQYAAHFKKAYDCGISAILFEGYDERIYRLCHEAGLESHWWLWTMNRKELIESHPDWFAVSRTGKSCATEPPYVDYYRFLCPSHPEVAEYLADDYSEKGAFKYVDGMHLDYVRFPDVVLPTSLWDNYGIDQTRELPEYDFCYCDLCCEKFKEQTGRDPRELRYAQEDQSWLNFRLDGITRVVTAIHNRLASEGKFLSAAVFPGPSMARKMVRQDWGNWPLEAYFPMTYNGFYNEGVEWIGRSVAESVKAVQGKSCIYAGLMFPDIEGELEKAVDTAYANGASGVSFFDGPDDAGLERLKAYLDKNGYVPQRANR